MYYYDLISYGESNPKLVMLILDDPTVPKYLILKYLFDLKFTKGKSLSIKVQFPKMSKPGLYEHLFGRHLTIRSNFKS